MIVYGTRAKLLASKSINQISCEYCSQHTSYSAGVYGRYFHVFWIPFFPVGKVVVAECQYCKRTVDMGQTHGLLRESLGQLKSESKAPAWQYSGFGVLGALAILLTFNSNKNADEMKLFSEKPLQGDKYEVKSANGYSIFKIASITTDSLFILENSYETDKVSGLYKIDKTENYHKTPVAISKGVILEKLANGEIIDINRP